MPSKKLPARASIASQRRSLARAAGSSSSSGPPPSHSDSPSGRPPRPRAGAIPAHWRKPTCGAAATLKRSDHYRVASAAEVSFKAKQLSVKKWLTAALAPELDFRTKLSWFGKRQELKAVLKLTVSRILADKKLVDQIWRLKKG